MEYEITERKENFLIVYEKISWNYLGDTYFLEFDNHVNVFDIDSISSFLINNEDDVFLVPYDNSDRVDVDTDLGSHMQFRYVKTSAQSKSGLSLVYYPLNSIDRNKWGDMVQYELDLTNKSVGKYISIVR